MSVNAFVIEPGEKPAYHQQLPGGDAGGSLQALQQLVGGYIEAVSGDDWTLYLNEEGKLQGLPVNRTATLFLNELIPGFAQRDVLVGTVVFVGADGRGGSADVPASILTRFQQWSASRDG